MADIHRGKSADTVDILLAVYIPNLIALAPLYNRRVVPLGEQHIAGVFKREKILQAISVYGQKGD